MLFSKRAPKQKGRCLDTHGHHGSVTGYTVELSDLREFPLVTGPRILTGPEWNLILMGTGITSWEWEGMTAFPLTSVGTQGTLPWMLVALVNTRRIDRPWTRVRFLDTVFDRWTRMVCVAMTCRYHGVVDGGDGGGSGGWIPQGGNVPSRIHQRWCRRVLRYRQKVRHRFYRATHTHARTVPRLRRVCPSIETTKPVVKQSTLYAVALYPRNSFSRSESLEQFYPGRFSQRRRSIQWTYTEIAEFLTFM